MGYSGNKLRKPFSIGDICTAIGSSVNPDVGYVCTHYPNMWAKYAPIEYDKVGVLTNAERISQNHGFKYTEYTNLLTLFNVAIATDGACTWTRTKPSTWFRMLDFCGDDDDQGYNSVAGQPFQYSLSNTEAAISETIEIGLNADGSRTATPDFSFDDFKGLTDTSGDPLKAGIAWRVKDASSGTSPWVRTFSTFESIQDFVVSSTYFTAGYEYDVVFFFSSIEYSTPTQSLSTGTYYLIPYPLRSLSVVSGRPVLTCVGTLSKTKDSLAVTISASNTYAMYNCYFTHEYNDATYTYTLGSVSVSSSTPYTATLTAASGDSWLDAEQLTFELHVTYNSTKYDEYYLNITNKSILTD